jgi:hypothetical protein
MTDEEGKREPEPAQRQKRMEKLAEILKSQPDARCTLRHLRRNHGFQQDEVCKLADENPYRLELMVVTQKEGGRPSPVVVLKTNHIAPDNAWRKRTSRDWSTPEEPLRGHFFHRVRNGILDWQGFIAAQFDDYVLLQLFSWFSGEQTNRHLVKISDLVWHDDEKKELVNGYLLYATRDEMLESYEHGSARIYRSDRSSRADNTLPKV